MLGAFRQRRSLPGQSKILEHFAVQHVAFPAVAAGLALRPDVAVSKLSGSAATLTMAVMSAVLCVPETQVSMRSADGPGDLFRPYPFALPEAVRRLEMMSIGDRSVNVVQALHLGLNHYLFTCVLGWLALRRPSSPGGR